MEPIVAVGIVALIVFGVGILYNIAHMLFDKHERKH